MYPKGEVLWVEYYNSRGELLFGVTSKAARDFYYLYENVGGKMVKRGRDKDPSVLAERFDVKQKMFA